MKMKAVKIIALVGVVGLTVTATALAFFNPGNVAETSEIAADRRLATRHYRIPKDQIWGVPEEKRGPLFALQVEMLMQLETTYWQKWKIVGRDIKADSATLRAEVPVFVFTDDLTLTMHYLPARDGNSELIEVVVDVRSASRVGKSDLGENRRHIAQILEALDSKIAADEKTRRDSR